LRVPLVADELYYIAWGHHPELGYFDHPPMVAWFLNLSGVPSRWLAFAVCHASIWILTDAGRLAGCIAWRWIPTILLATPLGMAWGVFWTPDAPLMLAWCLVVRSVLGGHAIVCGLALAFGLWSKSTMCLCVPGILWSLGPRSGGIAVGLALCLYAPHIAWSIAHEGLPWSYQADRHAFGFYAPVNLLTQLALAGPALAVFGLWHLWRRTDTLGATLYRLLCPIVIFWGGLSVWVRLEGNWPALIWPPLALMLTQHISAGIRRSAIGFGLVTIGTLVAVASHRPALKTLPDIRQAEMYVQCADALSRHSQLAAIRYQEKAQLDALHVKVEYARPIQRRRSQYDLWFPNNGLSCGDVVVGPLDVEWEACDARRPMELSCGMTIHHCHCAQKKTSEPKL